VHLTLVRHGESTWNATGQWQGQSDVPLSERGRAQARAIGERLKGASFDRRIASDLARARETAEAIGPCDHDPRLREIDVGAWAGLTSREVQERFGEEVVALRAGREVRIGGGEAMSEFEARVDAVFDELRGVWADRRVLAVTHGGVVRALCARLLGFRGGPSPLVGVGNTSITRVRCAKERSVVEVYNDGGHLDVIDAAAEQDDVARVAVIAVDPSAARDRALADAILSGLKIARIGAVGAAAVSALAIDLGVEPHSGGPMEALDAMQDGDLRAPVALALTPASARALIASLVRAEEAALALPPHGSVSQLRRGSRSAILHSYAVPMTIEGGRGV
jgi:probable phosphoglycerate mutase